MISSELSKENMFAIMYTSFVMGFKLCRGWLRQTDSSINIQVLIYFAHFFFQNVLRIVLVSFLFICFASSFILSFLLENCTIMVNKRVRRWYLSNFCMLKLLTLRDQSSSFFFSFSKLTAAICEFLHDHWKFILEVSRSILSTRQPEIKVSEFWNNLICDSSELNTNEALSGLLVRLQFQLTFTCLKSTIETLEKDFYS